MGPAPSSGHSSRSGWGAQGALCIGPSQKLPVRDRAVPACVGFLTSPDADYPPSHLDWSILPGASFPDAEAACNPASLPPATHPHTRDPFLTVKATVRRSFSDFRVQSSWDGAASWRVTLWGSSVFMRTWACTRFHRLPQTFSQETKCSDYA